MESTTYKIDKLKGAKNWRRFEYEMQAIFEIDDTWEVVSGEELLPDIPPQPMNQAAYTAADGSTVPAVAATQSQLDDYQRRLMQWDKDTKAWKKKNRKGIARLVFYTEEGPREHIKGLDTIYAQWEKLKKQYGASDLSTRDAALSAIARIESSSYKSIQEYTEAIKKQQTILTNMGVGLPAWQLSSFFRMGLEEGLEPYVFQLIQAAKASGQELNIDDMATALSEHDRRVKLQEETSKAMAARFGKQDKPEKPQHQRKNKKDTAKDTKPGDRKDVGTPPCSCCKSHRHGDTHCYYLHKHLRPEGWEATKGKEDLLIENQKKKASSARANGSTKPKSIRIVRTFSTKVINTSIPSAPKEQAVYMDTASDVHTLWDRSKFEDYKPSNKTLTGIDGKALRVLGIGTALYPRVLNGKAEYVRISSVHHVPDMDYNLLSITTLEDKGCYATIKEGHFDIIDSEEDKVVLSGTRVGKSYLLDLKYAQPPQALRSSKKPQANHTSWDKWHRRLGHLGIQDVKKLSQIATRIDAGMADQLQQTISPHKLCEECTIGKMSKTHSRISHRQDVTKRETVKGAKICSDLAGGSHIKVTKGGHRYCASFICEATDMV